MQQQPTTTTTTMMMMMDDNNQQPVQQQQGVGGEYNQNNNFNYNDCFPALPETRNSGASPQQQQQQHSPQQPAHNNTTSMRVGSRETSLIVKVAAEERPKSEQDSSFGEKESIRMCKLITRDTGATIEMNVSRDGSATFLITGVTDHVLEAKRRILSSFQTQASESVIVPKQHHRLILGKQAARLKELERETGTKITVPPAADASETIMVQGARDALGRAVAAIKQISDEQSRKASERLIVPRTFWPFFCGPQNSKLAELMAETRTKISLAPPSTGKDEIAILGDKDGVQAAKDHILGIYNEMKENSTTVSVEVAKSQHRYVIGPKGSGLAEIQEKTGVLVEMPPSDNETSTTVVLRGPQEKLGIALTMVYEKANSIVEQTVEVPNWVHRHLIGKKGADIQKLKELCPKVYVDFGDKDDKIRMEGPLEEVRKLKEKLVERATEVQETLDSVEMPVAGTYFKYIIGRGGANINRIKELTEANISIDRARPNYIRIEGTKAAVRDAQRELNDIVSKLENEVEEEVRIDSRLHSIIIGQKGETIREIRDRFNNEVNITFPAANEKSEVVRVRGPRADVDKCVAHLRSLVAERYTLDVPVFKQYHKLVIGKAGVNIKKIKDDTNTRIMLPSEDSKSDVITITGKKENVEQARDMILKIQEEQANIATESVPFALCTVQGRPRLIHAIAEDCNNVSVKLPSSAAAAGGGGKDQDVVVVRGPKEDVQRCVAQLKKLAAELKQSSFTATLKAKQQVHRVIIGKNGANIKRLRESTECHILFPHEQDADQELITIVGKKDNVEKAKQELTNIIKDIENVVVEEVEIDARHHKALITRRNNVTLVQRITDECACAGAGSVNISLPPRGGGGSGGSSSTVTVRGTAECVRLAKQRLLDAVDDLEHQVTVQCVIPHQHHRLVAGNRQVKAHELSATYNVHIRFPDNRHLNAENNEHQHQQQQNSVEEEGGEQLVNGGGGEGEGEGEPRAEDVVLITGRAERCEEAKQALLRSVPITQELQVPFDYHKAIIGAKGLTIRELSARYDVQISVPPSADRQNTIKVSGSPANVALANEAIQDKMAEVDAELDDRKKKSYEVKLTVSQDYFPKIIGKKGSVVNKIRDEFGVQIMLPARGSEDEDTITIVGYEERAEAAKQHILGIVHELDSQVKEAVAVDARIHPRLIGAKGRAIRKLMETFRVDVKFAKPSDDDPNIVIVSGSEENVQRAKEHLLELQQNFMDEIADYEFEQSFRPSHANANGGNPFDNLDFGATAHNTSSSSAAAPAASAANAAANNGNSGGGGGDHAPNGSIGGGANAEAGFVVKGAPWEQQAPPDTASQHHFPSFGGGAPLAASNHPSPVTWGPRR